MFKKLRNAIDDALSALEGRSDPTGEVDEVLAGMREELIEAKSALPRLEEGIEKLRRMRAAEFERAEDCVRRAGQAKEIGDTETLRLAVEYGERHRERARVYGEKLKAAEAELAMQRKSVREMSDQLKSAITHRDALKVRARRTKSGEALRGGADTAASRFDRMVEDIEEEAARAEAARDLDEELDLGGPGRFASEPLDDPAGMDAEALAEFQLEELKRRMKEEGRD